MYRNKAIQEIYDILAEFYECATDGYILDEERDKLVGTKDWADTILYRLEKLGMSPPIKESSIPLTGDDGVKHHIAVEVRDWEDKDD